MDPEMSAFQELIRSAVEKLGPVVSTLGSQLAKEQQKGQRRAFELAKLNRIVVRLKNKLKKKGEESNELQEILKSYAPVMLESWLDTQRLKYMPSRKIKKTKDAA